MGETESRLWEKWEGELRLRIDALPVGHEFEIKDLFEDEWNVEITGGERNAFGSMFQKVLKDPETYGRFDNIEPLGVKPNGDNHERYRRI